MKRFMYLSIGVLCMALLVSSEAFANPQIYATTDDGRKVVLKSDNTWEFVESNSKQLNSEFTFRRTTWGMTRDAVESSEPTEIVHDEGDRIVYVGNVAGRDCHFSYYFVNDKLVRAFYKLSVLHTDDNDCIWDYNEIKKLLLQKYGTPSEDEQFWIISKYKENEDKWCYAVGLGHLEYKTKWETEVSEIALLLFGKAHIFYLNIIYQSKAFGPITSKRVNRRSLEDL